MAFVACSTSCLSYVAKPSRFFSLLGAPFHAASAGVEGFPLNQKSKTGDATDTWLGTRARVIICACLAADPTSASEFGFRSCSVATFRERWVTEEYEEEHGRASVDDGVASHVPGDDSRVIGVCRVLDVLP